MDELVQGKEVLGINIGDINQFATYVSMDDFDKYKINTPVDIKMANLSQVADYTDKTKEFYVFSRSKVMIEGQEYGRIVFSVQPKYVK